MATSGSREFVREALRSLPEAFPPAYGARAAIDRASAASLDRLAGEVLGVPPLVLMELAARGVAEVAARIAPAGAPVLVVAGRGNNGGDGLAAARFLTAWGFRPRVVLVHGEPVTADARYEARAAREAGVPIDDARARPEALPTALAAGPVVVLDAIYGIGLTRPLDPADCETIARIDSAEIPILAIDLPSGLDADLGVPLPLALHAEVTATMVAPKAGFAIAKPFVGRVVCIDIGLPPTLLPPRTSDSRWPREALGPEHVRGSGSLGP